MSQSENKADTVLDPAAQDPFALLNRAAPPIISRFNFERPTEIVGRSNIDDIRGDDPVDVDIHDGTIITAHGYARLARHKPTGAICLFASKASLNLQGVRLADGAISATKDGLEKSYIVAAYRNSGRDEDIYQVAPRLRRALRRFNEDLGERSEKHFTLYGAQTAGQAGTAVEFYTNGRLAYKIEKQQRGSGYKVSFYTPTKRKDGSFVPVELGRQTLSQRFGRVSRVVSNAPDYPRARHDMAMHWQKVSSRLWDEKSIYQGEGFVLNAKKHMAQFFNYIAEKGLQLSLVTGAIGLGMGLISAKYGVIGGVMAAVMHTAAHHILDESYEASNKSLRAAREARNRLNIEAYPQGQDVANHFRIQTGENIAKLCAKMDLERFKAEDFEWLTAARSQMPLDHEKQTDGFRPSSLRAHLLFVHQRGFSSSCTLPDPHTRLDIFQSGLIRLMHEKPDGKTVIYSCYRPDACLEENLRLPADKIEKMGTEISRYEYDRRRADFHHAFSRAAAPVPLDDMMRDLEDNMLFRGRPDVPVAVKEASLQSIRATFAMPVPVMVQDNKAKPLYMNGNPPPLPPLAALT